jgi:hypothetical protein
MTNKVSNAGRPSTYNPESIDLMRQLLKQGALDCEICTALHISRATFYRWLNEYEDFKQAHEEGLEECEAWWTGKARECFLSRDDKGFKYFISTMNNKFGWEKGSKGQDTTSTTINIGNMNVLQQKSRTELLDYIHASIEKHSDVIEIKGLDEKVIDNSEITNKDI